MKASLVILLGIRQMSSLLLSNSRIWIVLFVLFIELANAGNFGIEPSEVKIEMNSGEVRCQNYQTNGDFGAVFVNASWSPKKSRDVRDYTIGEIEGVEIAYPKSFVAGDEFNVCLNAIETGNYYGLLIFEQDSSNVILGSWMSLKVVEENKSKMGNFFTGLSVDSNILSENDESKMLRVLIFETLFLFCVLLTLILLARKREIY